MADFFSGLLNPERFYVLALPLAFDPAGNDRLSLASSGRRAPGGRSTDDLHLLYQRIRPPHGREQELLVVGFHTSRLKRRACRLRKTPVRNIASFRRYAIDHRRLGMQNLLRHGPRPLPRAVGRGNSAPRNHAVAGLIERRIGLHSLREIRTEQRPESSRVLKNPRKVQAVNAQASARALSFLHQPSSAA